MPPPGADFTESFAPDGRETPEFVRTEGVDPARPRRPA